MPFMHHIPRVSSPLDTCHMVVLDKATVQFGKTSESEHSPIFMKTTLFDCFRSRVTKQHDFNLRSLVKPSKIERNMLVFPCFLAYTYNVNKRMASRFWRNKKFLVTD